MCVRRKRITQTQQRHAQECEQNAQVLVVIQAQTLDEQLQGDAGHDAGRDGEQAPVRHRVGRQVGVLGELEPQHGDASPERLAQAAQYGCP